MITVFGAMLILAFGPLGWTFPLWLWIVVPAVTVFTLFSAVILGALTSAFTD